MRLRSELRFTILCVAFSMSAVSLCQSVAAGGRKGAPASVTPGPCSLKGGGSAATKLEDDSAVLTAAEKLAFNLTRAYRDDRSRIPNVSAQSGTFLQSVLAEIICAAVVPTVNAVVSTSQTNKQNGAPASSNGSTSAVQKVGIPQLLGVAVENGAITNNVTGNTMTLSSSPYAAFAAFGKDDESGYLRCSLCTQLGVSATFNLTNTSDPLQSATRKQVSQWQAKYVLKDTSIRSKGVQTLYRADAGLSKRAEALAEVMSGQENGKPMNIANLAVNNAIGDHWVSVLEPAVLKAASGITATSQPSDPAVKAIATQLLQYLDQDEGFQNQLAALGRDPEIVALSAKYVAALRDYVTEDKAFESSVKALQDGWNGDVTLSQQFPSTTTTPSTASASSTAASSATVATATAMPAYLVAGLDLSFQPKTDPDSTNGLSNDMRPNTTMNFGSSFYSNPNPSLNEQTFRGGTAAVQFQWNMGKGPFVKDPNDKDQMTLSISGKYSRLQENEHQPKKKADSALGNLKLEIPISAGVSLPLSMTVANSSEQVKETYVRGNFGVSFDLDKLTALLSAKK